MEFARQTYRVNSATPSSPFLSRDGGFWHEAGGVERGPRGDNRVIFDLGGNKYRLIVHISFAFGRVLVKFIGTHAEYDRIDPETVSWRRK
jgi:hypothetical protein